MVSLLFKVSCDTWIMSMLCISTNSCMYWLKRSYLSIYPIHRTIGIFEFILPYTNIFNSAYNPHLLLGIWCFHVVLLLLQLVVRLVINGNIARNI